jgi:hypothetical protein
MEDPPIFRKSRGSATLSAIGSTLLNPGNRGKFSAD